MRFERFARPVISVTTVIVLVLVPVVIRPRSHIGHFSPAGAQQSTDAPQRLGLTPVERDAIRDEMRMMLQSLGGIMQGLAAGDLVMVERAARASGVVMAVDPRLEKKLSPPFLQLLARTHKRFDVLADAIKAGATRDAVLRRLAAITASCVTCHDTYRLGERQE